MNSTRPAHVKPPAYLSANRPVPQPETTVPEATVPETSEHGGPNGLEPTRYRDWENNGICWDF
jgi:hypothetical protein